MTPQCIQWQVASYERVYGVTPFIPIAPMFILTHFRGELKMLDCSIEVSKFELQSCYYVYFQTNTLGERYELTYPPSYGINSFTAVLLQEWFWL